MSEDLIQLSNGEWYNQTELTGGIFDRLVRLRSQVNFLLVLSARDLVERRGTPEQKQEYAEWETRALEQIMLKAAPDETKKYDVHLPDTEGDHG